MVPNMKFFVISIVAIFAALGIGIYIGFTLDAQSFVVDQREDIASKLEERFDYQKEENEKLKIELIEMEKNNKSNEEYINNTYGKLIEGQLSDRKVLVIETNSDYIYSGIGKSLEEAGADLLGVVTFRDKFFSEEDLKRFYKTNSLELEEKDIISDLSLKVSDALVEKNNRFLDLLKEEEIIDVLGYIDEDIDTIILAGGSLRENDKISKVDQNIISYFKNRELSIVGVEKSNVNHSYMDLYKSSKISTVDNIDSFIGKVSMVYAIDSYPGNYGIKQTADALMPILNEKPTEF